MAEKVFMIALSPTMEDGTIINWNKSEGDSVASGDVLCEVETDKAAMDYESTQEGTLLKIVVNEGGSAKVGDLIAVIGEKGEDFGSLVNEASEGKKDAKTQVKEKKSESNEKPKDEKNEKADSAEAVPRSAESDSRIKASPLARKLAEQKKIDLSVINGSGPGGRIIKRDIENTAPASASDSYSSKRDDTVIQLNNKRKVIAKRTTESKNTAPHFYLKLSVYMDSLLAGRKKINSEREKRLSLNAFIIKLCAETLKKHPYVNASWNNDSITLFGSVDIGLAVALDDGLLTPVVKDCGSKSISQIDEELSALIGKAKNGSLQPAEYTNPGFTISNLGSSGIEEFTAIINAPGSAILAVGASVKTPVVIDDEITVKQVLKLTLSCDHRVIDGKVGADFLADLKRAFEDPLTALL